MFFDAYNGGGKGQAVISDFLEPLFLYLKSAIKTNPFVHPFHSALLSILHGVALIGVVDYITPYQISAFIYCPAPYPPSPPHFPNIAVVLHGHAFVQCTTLRCKRSSLRRSLSGHRRCMKRHPASTHLPIAPIHDQQTVRKDPRLMSFHRNLPPLATTKRSTIKK